MRRFKMNIKRVAVLVTLLAVIGAGYYLYLLEMSDPDDVTFRAAKKILLEDLEQSRRAKLDMNQFQQGVPIHRLPVDRLQQLSLTSPDEQNVPFRRPPIDGQRVQQNVPFRRPPIDGQRVQQNVPFRRPPIDGQRVQQNIPFLQPPIDGQRVQQNVPFRRPPIDGQRVQQNVPFRRPPLDGRQRQQNNQFPHLQAGGLKENLEAPTKRVMKLFPNGIQRIKRRSRRDVQAAETDDSGADLTLLEQYLEQQLKSIGAKQDSPSSADSGPDRENAQEDSEALQKLVEKKQAERTEQQTRMLQQLLSQQQSPARTTQPSQREADLEDQQTLLQKLLSQLPNPTPYDDKSAYQAVQQQPADSEQERQITTLNDQQYSHQQNSTPVPEQDDIQRLLEELLAQQQDPTQHHEQQSSDGADQNQQAIDPPSQHTVTTPEKSNERANSFLKVKGEIDINFEGTFFWDENGQLHFSINGIQPEEKSEHTKLLDREQTAQRGQTDWLSMLDKLLEGASDLPTEQPNTENLEDEIEEVIGNDPFLKNKVEEIKTNLTRDIEEGLEPEVELEDKTYLQNTTNGLENRNTTEAVQTQSSTTPDNTDQPLTTGVVWGRTTQTTEVEKDQTLTTGGENGQTESTAGDDKSETRTKPEAQSQLNVSLYDFSQVLDGAFRCKTMRQPRFLSCVVVGADHGVSEPTQEIETELLEFQSILDTDTSLGALVVSADAAEFTVTAAKKSRDVVAIETDKEKIPPFHRAMMVNNIETSLVSLITDEHVDVKDLAPVMTFPNVVVKLDDDPEWASALLTNTSNLFNSVNTVNVTHVLMPWRWSADVTGHSLLNSTLTGFGLQPVDSVKTKNVHRDIKKDLNFVVWTRVDNNYKQLNLVIH